VVDSYQDNADVNDPDFVPYDKRRLSYAGTFTNPFKVNLIRATEWTTGKFKLLRLIRKFERQGAPVGQPFWPAAMEVMGIDIQTPAEQIARIPKQGPVVVVANHPHGLVDGMVMATIIGQVREDYKILTRSLLTGIPEIEQFMIPVAFPHEADAQRLNIEMRQKSMAHLKAGGVVILFPAGSVATSATLFGPAIEPEWNPFTAKMIQRSGAAVLPIRFKGQNTRLFQIANKLSITIRQGLLLHEVAHVLNKPQAPIIGHALAPEELAEWKANPRGLMAWLRDRTLAMED